MQLTSCFASTEALHHEAVWLLFGAPRLWIFTSLDVQLEVYEVLQTFVERKPRAFLSPSASGEPLLSLQHLLDILEVYYWRQPSAASFARQPLRHAVSGAVIGERPSTEGLRRLRRKVLNLLQVLHAHRPAPDPSPDPSATKRLQFLVAEADKPAARALCTLRSTLTTADPSPPPTPSPFRR